MSTRFAQIQDTPKLTDLLLEFGREARVGFRSARNQDHQRLSRMLGIWMRDHYVRVAEHNTEIVGLLVAERGQDFWDPERRILQERVWYVCPEHRHSRASARLWSAWQQDSDQYVKTGTVDMVIMSTQGPTTQFDPGHRGWRLIEQTWIKE
jgi:hypothetical protein